MFHEMNFGGMRMQSDPAYELKRVTDEQAFYRKLKVKRRLNRWVGEMYVGKRVKLAYFRQWLAMLDIPADARVLEVGSGDGLFCFHAAAALPRASFTGMELNPVEAKVCQRIAEEEKFDNLQFVNGLLDNFRWSEQFDFIFCLDVMEHIEDDVAALRQMLQALKPGGKLLIHVPSRFFKNTDGTVIFISDADAWKINPGHVRPGYTVQELHDKLCTAGFTPRRYRQTQGWHIAKAHELHARSEKSPLRRLLILPMLCYLTWRDMHRPPEHGNTLWMLAERPV